jgi:hypothetical protein
MCLQGSEVSVRSAWVTERGQILFNPLKKEFQLHYHHNDAILNLPPDFWVLASNNVTEFQSIVCIKSILLRTRSQIKLEFCLLYWNVNSCVLFPLFLVTKVKHIPIRQINIQCKRKYA